MIAGIISRLTLKECEKSFFHRERRRSILERIKHIEEKVLSTGLFPVP